MTPGFTADRPIRTSAMYRAQLASGARFTEGAGWRVADVYTSTDDEVARARTGVGLCDVSACGKLGVRGDRIESWGTNLTGGAVPAVGRASRQHVNAVPVLVCRRTTDELLLLTSAVELPVVAGVVAGTVEGAGCVHVTDLTSAFAAVDLVGDKVGALLERLVALDLSTLAALDLVHGELAHVHAIMLRLDHPTLPVVRTLVPREYGDFVWKTLESAGHDLGVTPVGAAAHARLMSS